MSHPANPPSYDTLYGQGVTVQTHPVIITTQPQPPVIIHVPQHQQTVENRVVVLTSVDVESCLVVCPSCHYNIATRTEMKPAMRTHLWAACLFFCGLWPCCVVPYCIPSCNNVDHYCPKCSAYVGSYTG